MLVDILVVANVLVDELVEVSWGGWEGKFVCCDETLRTTAKEDKECQYSSQRKSGCMSPGENIL